MTPSSLPVIDNESIAPRILAGFSAIIIGIGLNRFSYIAFIPILITANWLTPEQAGYLGAANLLGYLLGALSANATALKFGVRSVVRANMLISIISFAACAWPLGFEWLAFWRLVAGVTGAQLMVVAVPAVLSAIPPSRKGRASGIVFSGIGFGIIFSGLAMPQLAELGVVETWLILGLVCVFFSALAWSPWEAKPQTIQTASAAPAAKLLTWPVILLLGAYALDAFGFVPHTVFWVDFIARGLGHGKELGGFFWMLVGLGAVFGPVLAGWSADKIGFKWAMTLAFGMKAAAVSLPLIDTSLPLLTVSSLVVGAIIPGMVALVSGFTAVLVGPEKNRQVWGWMTFAFAILQAVSGFFMAWLFDVTASYFPLFQAGWIALAMGAILALISPRPSTVHS
ncbi:YbfB/YjiJ family MFS transporter [Aestuariispira insulae]|uniref:Putative MFS family arabinose efflux permease n=1 Tax=Aestuariispira insulae TaxID=1461337 RepID=A0A3D9HSY9_9PROT|nr:YbfB/YjiJ family MFS transporter [Aestuariispira insulae]RED51986.1 putative MFS family arabinose efflux permease [Aestuariispira insulae]